MSFDRRLVHSAYVSLAVLTAVVVSCNPEPSQLQAISLPDTLTAQDSTALETQIAQFAGPWHDAPCTGCQANGEVKIRAVGKTTDIKANDGPPRRLVGQIQNTSGEDVTHGPSGFVFKAHKTYLLFVSRAASPATNAQWGMTVFGLGYNPKNEASPDYFMNLQPEEIQGTELRFELYPNRLLNSLDILTGKALFNKDGKALFEAGISMWEE